MNLDPSLDQVLKHEAMHSRSIRLEATKPAEFRAEAGRQKLMLLQFPFLAKVDDLKTLQDRLSTYAPLTDGIVRISCQHLLPLGSHHCLALLFISVDYVHLQSSSPVPDEHRAQYNHAPLHLPPVRKLLQVASLTILKANDHVVRRQHRRGAECPLSLFVPMLGSAQPTP